MKCSNCGCNFRLGDAKLEFENYFNGIYYDSDQHGLCGYCAIDKMETWLSEGDFFMKCSNCGCNFCVGDAKVDFENHFNGIYYDQDGLCGYCAIDKMETWFLEMNSQLDLNQEEDDDFNGESLSVYDAAAIWASHGKDEDYTFGYTEEDLENAL